MVTEKVHRKWHYHLLILLQVLCLFLNIHVGQCQQRGTTPRGIIIPSTTPFYDTSHNNGNSGSERRRSSSTGGYTDESHSMENIYNPNDLTFPQLIGRGTTRRPPLDIYPDNVEGSHIRSTTTTRRPYIFQTTPAPPPPVQLAPKLNLTAEDSNNDMIPMVWSHYLVNGTNVNEASLNIRGLRQLKLTFTCNDTFPIKWFSRKSFGTSTWKVDEYRSVTKGWRDLPEILYTIVLKLTYEKEDSVPSKQELFCSRIKSSDVPSSKPPVVEIVKRANSSLSLKQISDTRRQWIESMDDLKVGKLQYMEPLGANDGCFQELTWDKRSKKFDCIGEPNSNLTIDFVYNNCYDAASCERRYTYTKKDCWRTFNRRQTESKAPTDMWTRDPPPSGVVFCKRRDEVSENKTAALAFYHSLPEICPEDHPAGRRQLYISSDLPIPNDNILRRDFVSFCTTKDAFKKADLTATESPNEDIPTKYAGENMTVSCIASLYHFAHGTRIGQRLINGTIIYNAVVTDKKVNDNEGYINYTAKVLITDTSVAGIQCENYVKESRNSISKLLRIAVKSPQNISFVDKGLSQFTLYNYSGQPNFVLRCAAKGDPLPKIIWRKQNQPISEIIKTFASANETYAESELIFPSKRENRKLNVSNLHGIYICEAANRLNSIERTFHVNLVTANSSSITIVNTGTTSSEVKEGGEESSSLWYVWAIIIPLFLLLVFAVIGFLVWKIKRQSQELQLLSKQEVDEFNFGKPSLLQHHSSTEEVNNYAAYLPYNKGYEVGKEQLELDPNAILGSGAYAIVLKGVLQQKNGYSIPVAIKTAKPMDDVSFFKALLSELKIMAFIGTHQNIVNLVGAYTRNIQNREIFIAIEYCDKGSLLTYLRDNRERFTSLIGENGEFPQNVSVTRDSILYPDREGITTITLIKWAQEIAAGMEFLGQKKVVHGDLAARNILLTEHLVAKIGDFGLSRQLFEYANYIKKQMSPLPWKWLAVECLQDMKFSVKSDVWAYSILLYEIFSLGQVPYPGHSYNDEFLDALVSGKRPNKPPHTTNNIYTLMSKCWKENAYERPSFTYIQDYFKNMLTELVPPEYLILHERLSAVRSPSTPSGSPVISPSNTLNNPNGGKKDFFLNMNPKTITASFKLNSNH